MYNIADIPEWSVTQVECKKKKKKAQTRNTKKTIWQGFSKKDKKLNSFYAHKRAEWANTLAA